MINFFRIIDYYYFYVRYLIGRSRRLVSRSLWIFRVYVLAGERILFNLVFIYTVYLHVSTCRKFV